MLILVLPMLKISAQEVNFAFTGHVTVPQSEFRNNIDAIGGGLGFYGTYGFAGMPLSIGLDFSFSNFGTDSREEAISPTIPDLKVRVDNSYNLGQGFLTFRLQPEGGAVRPYAEGLIGFNYFYTETSINDRRSYGGNEPVISDVNFEDTAFAWGGGTGIKFRVFDWSSGVPESVGGTAPPRMGYVTVGFRYLMGGEAEYLQKGSIQINDGQVSYDVSRSRTDMTLFQLGFLLRW